MFIKLKSNDYYKVAKLFNRNFSLEIASIIKKKCGQIFVDNELNPQTACIFNNYHNFYIAGKTNNPSYNNDFSNHLLNSISPTMRKSNCLDFYIHYGDLNEWSELLENILKKHHVNKINWRYYVYNKMKTDLNIELPSGYILKKIDAELLKQADLKNINKINTWLSETWLNQQDFLLNGFGFCIINDNCIVSWCLADFVIKNKCEIGIETDEDYRQKGFATKTLLACVKYCLSIGINYIGWRCLESNIGSQKTAEKVGFRLAKNYSVIFGWYNRFDNYLVHAYSYYCKQNYLQASLLYEKAFELMALNKEEVHISQICNSKNKFWFYFNAARVYAQLGNIEASVSKLKLSFKMGLSKNMFIKEKSFKVLNNHKELTKLLNEYN